MNDFKLNNLLICPICKLDLILNDKNLHCEKCSKNYNIVEGIPVLVDLSNLDAQLKGQIEYFDNDPVLKDLEYKEYAWQKSYITRFMNTVPLKDTDVVLDCATGTGYLAIALAKKGHTVYATDLNLNALIRLKNIAKSLNLSENLHFICCSAESIPLKDNLVNVVIANAIIEHLSDDLAAIKEFTRISKLDSYAMITTPLEYKYLNPLFVGINKYYDKQIGHLRRYDEPTYIQKFKGWSLVKTYYTGYFLKALLVLINKVLPIINEDFIEKVDLKHKQIPQGATSIISFFKLYDKKIS